VCNARQKGRQALRFKHNEFVLFLALSEQYHSIDEILFFDDMLEVRDLSFVAV